MTLEDARNARIKAELAQTQPANPGSESGRDDQFHATGVFSTEKALLADMLRVCKEQEIIERKIDVLRRINALLPAARLVIPSLVTMQYIEYALSDIVDMMLPAT